MSSVLYLHDDVTSWRHVMTSKTGCTLSQLVQVLERGFFFCFYGFRLAQFKNVIVFVCAWCHDVMTWRHDVTKLTSPISACRCSEVMVHISISVDISTAGFQSNLVKALAWCLYVITWRHDVTKITTWLQITNCLHLSLLMCSRADSIPLLWFLWWLDSTWLLSSYLHAGITSQNDVMTSLNMLCLYQLVGVLGQKRYD